ncbi:MAG: hypothetical protein WC842_03020 [Candidatus Paceibacterota bacterium]|jgi:DNA polymerase-3 subunit delta'
MWGLDHYIQLFVRVIKNDTLGASYCFFGDDGVGKMTCARAIASYLETGQFDSNTIDTRIFIPNEKGTFGIDDARQVKEFCSSAPFVSKRKTAIVRCGEEITDQAQSALLKLLEEPPIHTLIIIIVRNKDLLFAPILSRLQCIYFSRYTRKQVVDFLVSEHKILGNEAEKIAEQSFGSLGKALSIAHKDIETVDRIEHYIEKEIERYYKNGILKHSSLLSKLLKKEADVKGFTVNGPLQKKAIQYIESGT